VVGARRSIGDDHVGPIAVAHHVLAHFHLHGHDGAHRFDAGDIDLPRDLSPALLTVLYRTLQEGLTNVLRHADARRVRIEASASPRGVTLILQDDGRGFDPNAPRPASAGIGLANLRRRLQSLGGRLEIHSAPGQGVRLAVFVPPAARSLRQG